MISFPNRIDVWDRLCKHFEPLMACESVSKGKKLLKIQASEARQGRRSDVRSRDESSWQRRTSDDRLTEEEEVTEVLAHQNARVLQAFSWRTVQEEVDGSRLGIPTPSTCCSCRSFQQGKGTKQITHMPEVTWLARVWCHQEMGDYYSDFKGNREQEHRKT
jgi:hypothetical protein